MVSYIGLAFVRIIDFELQMSKNKPIPNRNSYYGYKSSARDRFSKLRLEVIGYCCILNQFQSYLNRRVEVKFQHNFLFSLNSNDKIIRNLL